MLAIFAHVISQITNRITLPDLKTSHHSWLTTLIASWQVVTCTFSLNQLVFFLLTSRKNRLRGGRGHARVESLVPVSSPLALYLRPTLIDCSYSLNMSWLCGLTEPPRWSRWIRTTSLRPFSSLSPCFLKHKLDVMCFTKNVKTTDSEPRRRTLEPVCFSLRRLRVVFALPLSDICLLVFCHRYSLCPKKKPKTELWHKSFPLHNLLQMQFFKSLLSEILALSQ